MTQYTRGRSAGPSPKQNWKNPLAGLPDFEHFRTTDRTRARSCRLAVLHGNRLSVFDLTLGLAFNAIGFHIELPFLKI